VQDSEELFKVNVNERLNERFINLQIRKKWKLQLAFFYKVELWCYFLLKTLLRLNWLSKYQQKIISFKFFINVWSKKIKLLGNNELIDILQIVQISLVMSKKGSRSLGSEICHRQAAIQSRTFDSKNADSSSKHCQSSLFLLFRPRRRFATQFVFWTNENGAIEQ
jgi:hypothetical protein